MVNALPIVHRPPRLDAEERAALAAALAAVGNPPAYLFGSRADPSARGGDIDLLVFATDDPFLLAQRIAREFFMRCEEKIDVTVMDPARLTPEQQAFLDTLTLVELPR